VRETFATTVPGDDVVINRAGQSVAMAVGLPMRREIAAQARLPERLEADLLIIFEGGRFPRHHAARKDNVAVVGAGGPRQPDQRVLAGPARTYHQNEPARSDHGG
jgi:hypothetical protein